MQKNAKQKIEPMCIFYTILNTLLYAKYSNADILLPNIQKYEEMMFCPFELNWCCQIKFIATENSTRKKNPILNILMPRSGNWRMKTSVWLKRVFGRIFWVALLAFISLDASTFFPNQQTK